MTTHVMRESLVDGWGTNRCYLLGCGNKKMKVKLLLSTYREKGTDER